MSLMAIQPHWNSKIYCDPYWENVTCLITGDEATNLFTDLSPRGTSAGHFTKAGAPISSSTQKVQGGKSLYLDGASNIVAPTDVTDAYKFNTDCCVEAWVYLTALPNNDSGVYRAIIAGTWDNSLNPTGWRLGLTATSTEYTGLYLWDGLASYSPAFRFNLNTWYHIALTKENLSATAYLWVNGYNVWSSAVSGAFNSVNNTVPLSIGKQSDATYPHFFKGYIDDFRITRGSARYTTTFNPLADYKRAEGRSCDWGAACDPYKANVVLHLPFNGVPADKSTMDVTGRHGVVFNGTALIAPDRKKFGRTSWRSDCSSTTGGAITVTGNPADFAPGTGAFTIEGWRYCDSLSFTSEIFRDSGSAANTMNFKFVGGNTLSLGPYGGVFVTSSTFTAAINTWYHFVVQRDEGGILSMYWNGTRVYNAAHATNYNVAPTAMWFLTGSNGGANSQWTDDLRWTNGVARYSGASFTVPSQEHSFRSCAPVVDPKWEAVFLQNFDDSTDVYADRSYFNHAKTDATTPAVNTGTKKFGYAALNTGHYHYKHPELDLATASEWTIEFWIQAFSQDISAALAITRDGTLIGSYSDAADTQIRFGFYSHFLGIIQADGGTRYFGGIQTASLTGNWTHIAMVRYNGNVDMYQNGVRLWRYAGITNLNQPANLSLNIGGLGTAISSQSGGSKQLDSIRIMRKAVYTQNFIPPTRAAIATLDPDYVPPSVSQTPGVDHYWEYTKLLCHGESLVDSTGRHTITAQGTAAVSTTRFVIGSSSLKPGGGYANRFDVTGNQADFALGTSPFTIEGWVYLNSLSGESYILCGDASNSLQVYIRTNGNLVIGRNAIGIDTEMAASAVAGYWYYFSINRNADNQLTMYWNGKLLGTVTNSVNYNTTPSITWIGGKSAGSLGFDGYIDELRLTVGISRN